MQLSEKQRKIIAIASGIGIAAVAVAAIWGRMKAAGTDTLSYEPSSPTVLIDQGGSGGSDPIDWNIPDFKSPDVDVNVPQVPSTLPQVSTVVPTVTPTTTPMIIPETQDQPITQQSSDLTTFGHLWGNLGWAAVGTYAASRLGLFTAIRQGITKLANKVVSKPVSSYIAGGFILPTELTDPSGTLATAYVKGLNQSQPVLQTAYEQATEWSKQYGPIAPAALVVSYPIYAISATSGWLTKGLSSLFSYQPQSPDVPATQQTTVVPPPGENLE